MVKIREAVPADIEKISRINCACYDLFVLRDNYEPQVVEKLKLLRGSRYCIEKILKYQTVFVAEDGDSVTGMVAINENEIDKLFVHPDFQRKGIGQKLFVRALEYIKSNGHALMFLGTANPSALPFYEKMGMQIKNTHTINCGPCNGMTSTICEKIF